MAEVTSAEKQQDSRIESGSGTILLAEDDPAALVLLKELLERARYKVITAADGEEAVKKFVAHQDEIVLVVSDLIMPKKSGKRAYNEIREMNSGIKFIFLSGHSKEVIDREGKLGDDVEIIMKPVIPLDLLRRIGTILTDKND